MTEKSLSFIFTIIPNCKSQLAWGGGVWKRGRAGWNWWRNESRHVQRYWNLPWFQHVLPSYCHRSGTGCQHVEQLNRGKSIFRPPWSKLSPTEISRLVPGLRFYSILNVFVHWLLLAQVWNPWQPGWVIHPHEEYFFWRSTNIRLVWLEAACATRSNLSLRLLSVQVIVSVLIVAKK